MLPIKADNASKDNVFACVWAFRRFGSTNARNPPAHLSTIMPPKYHRKKQHLRRVNESSSFKRPKAVASQNGVPNPTMSQHQAQSAPPWIQLGYQIDDELETQSSVLIQDAAETCIPLIQSPLPGVLDLARDKHLNSLHSLLADGLPAGYTALDASKPWLLYWALMALSLLGYEGSAYTHRYALPHLNLST